MRKRSYVLMTCALFGALAVALVPSAAFGEQAEGQDETVAVLVQQADDSSDVAVSEGQGESVATPVSDVPDVSQDDESFEPQDGEPVQAQDETASCDDTEAEVPAQAEEQADASTDEGQATAAVDEGAPAQDSALQEEPAEVAEPAQAVVSTVAEVPGATASASAATAPAKQTCATQGSSKTSDGARQTSTTKAAPATSSAAQDVKLTAASEPVLKDDAVYAIRNKGASESGSKVRLATAKNATAVTLEKTSALLGQYWRVIAGNDDETYYLVNYNGDMGLSYTKAKAGAAVRVVTGKGSCWAVSVCDDGWLRLSPQNYLGLALDIYDEATTAGSKAQLSAVSDDVATQRFAFDMSASLTEALKAGKTLNAGLVTLASSANSKRVVDIAGASTKHKANVQVSASKNALSQKFAMDYAGNGLYTFKNVKSGKLLSAASTSAKSGVNVQQRKANSTVAQYWYILRDGNGYAIVNAGSGNALTIDAATPAKGANINVRTFESSARQRFLVKETSVLVDGGIYTIKPLCAPKNVIALASNSAAYGTSVVTAALTDALGCYWRATAIAGGRMKLSSLLSGYELSVRGKSSAKAGKAAVAESGISWDIIVNANGSYTLSPKANAGLALDIPGASSKRGLTVRTHKRKSGKAQSFKFVLNKRLTTLAKSGETVEGGIVTIASVKNAKKVLDIAGGSTAEGANVQLYASNNTFSQKYQLTYEGNGLYSIKAAVSGKNLSVKNNATKKGSNVQVAKEDGVLAQRWCIVKAGAGYAIRNAKSGLALSLARGKTKNGTNVNLASYASSGSAVRAQRFTIASTQLLQDGTYAFSSGVTYYGSLVLDVKGSSKKAGANVLVNQTSGVNSQKWTVKHLGSGIYTLKNLYSGKLLNVLDGSEDDRANVNQQSDDGGRSKQWVIEVADGGGMLFRNLNSGKYLEVTGSKSAVGTNVRQNARSGSRGQVWNVKTDHERLPSGKLGTFVSKMVWYADIASLGYDQSQRWNIYDGGECDCSSLVVRALRDAGFNTGGTPGISGASYTGDMSYYLTRNGWQRLRFNIKSLKPGDILLNDAYHTCVVISGKGTSARIAQASIDERGYASGGATGDQSGYETNIKTVYVYPYGGWNCILRYPS